MRSASRCGLVLRTALAIAIVIAMTFGGRALAQERAAKSTGTKRPAAGAQTKEAVEPDFKVVFWYDKRDPLFTFEFQKYDLRTGQYTAAVEHWLETMRRQYPNHRAYVKDVKLPPGAAQAAADKAVATVILEELKAIGGPYQGHGLRDAGGLFGGGGLSNPRGGQRLNVPSSRMPWSPGAPGSYGSPFGGTPGASQPPAYSFPTPLPYPRPHP